MVANVDRAAAALGGADREPLSESSGSRDGWLVDTLRGVDVIGTAV